MNPQRTTSQCEMCGAVTATRRHLLGATEMLLGACCSKYGQPLDAPAKQGTAASRQQGLERRAQRMTSKDIYQEERLDLVADFGARVKHGRERKNIAYDMLGTKVQATVPQLHKIERGELRPSDKLAKALERELGITLMEKVEADAAAVGGVTKPSKAGLTIGDLLKDAMKKK